MKKTVALDLSCGLFRTERVIAHGREYKWLTVVKGSVWRKLSNNDPGSGYPWISAVVDFSSQSSTLRRFWL